MSNGISVCILTKNVAKYFSDCLNSIREFIRPSEGDEIVVLDTGSSDDTLKIAKEYGAQVFEHPELNQRGMLSLVKEHLPDFYQKCSEDVQFSDGFLKDFSEARTISFNHAKNDICFWIDSDDVLFRPKEIREEAFQFFKQNQNSAIFLPYEYAYTADGACETLLWRERILRKHLFQWAGRCHETLVPLSGSMVVTKTQTPSTIQHKHGRHHLYSDIRNYVILLEHYREDPYQDPRTELYLGNACRGLANGKTGNPWYKRAIEWYFRAFKRSGCRDDRVNIVLNIAYIHHQHGRTWRAIDWFHQAIKLYPAEPRAYFGIAHCYHDLKRWNDCLIWTKFGRELGRPEHVISVDPLAYDYYPTLFEILSLKNLKQYDLALQLVPHLLQIRPNFSAAQTVANEINAEREKENVLSVVRSVSQLAFSPAAAREIHQRIKPEIRRRFPELQLETCAPPPDHHVTFFCAGNWEAWDATSLENGIGGSEKMVIQIAEGLAKRGWNVDVYGNPIPVNAYRTLNKVTYRPYQSFNTDFPRDNLILWRSPALLDIPFHANKIFVDMHDVSNNADWTPERLSKLTGAFFKSKFHRETASSLPDTKVILSRNGIDISTLPENGARAFKRLVWLSSPDRGLLGALRTYSLLKTDHPDAEFYVFYGFTPLYTKKAANQEYEFMGDERAERHMLEYQEDIFSLMDKLDVTFCDRTGHSQLMKHLSEASIWLYPTRFPEISCISAMEAQAMGVLPVCTHNAALAETVDFGTPIPDPNDYKAIASSLSEIFEKGKDLDDYRHKMQTAARKRFNLDDLVTQWEQELKK